MLQSPCRIKVCGITRREDARYCVAAGVDAVGLVFYAQSPRAVNIRQAVEIAKVVGPFVSVVALFVNPSVGEVRNVLNQVPVTLLQFHGDESAEFCAQFNRPWMKAVRFKPELNLNQVFADYEDASALLFDTYKPGVAGGTGETFDWEPLVEKLSEIKTETPVVLAGGLNPDNVADAVSRVRPYGVDVSGGVESIPGIKSLDKIHKFVLSVQRS